MCQMDLLKLSQDHDRSDMDNVTGDDTLRQQWERYVNARKAALAARSPQASAGRGCSTGPDTPSADAPIARFLHLVPGPRSKR
jgi:hypothetical protein